MVPGLKTTAQPEGRMQGKGRISEIMKYHRLFLFLPMVFFGVSCNNDRQQKPVDKKTVQAFRPAGPAFNSDSAYLFIKQQVDFGPRVPNSKAHVACGNFLTGKLKEYTSDVIIQQATVTAYDGTTLKMKNIIAEFNRESKTRILLFAHWDTRPWADRDTTGADSPSLGADDGGSGVGVLLEMARLFSIKKPAVGVDIAFFDAEDWGKKDGGAEGEDSYALGTQYWTKHLHVPDYTATYGILLDMVGARQATFRMEGNSMQDASFVVDKVWKTASRLGYSDYFLFQEGGWVTDDHLYVNRINIPSIDIINSDLSTLSGFPAHWHTHADNMDVIDKNTLRAVGQTLVEVVYSEGTVQNP